MAKIVLHCAGRMFVAHDEVRLPGFISVQLDLDRQNFGCVQKPPARAG